MIEIDFQLPKLDLYFLIKKTIRTRDVLELKEYLINTQNIKVYNLMISKGIFEKDEKEVEKIKSENEEIVSNLLEEGKNEMEKDSIKLKLLDFYSKSMNLDKFEEGINEVENQNKTFKLDVLFQKIRVGIILENEKMVIDSFNKADKIVQNSDWDRKNRYKVYKGLFCLMNGDFKKASEYFFESLNTFEAVELISFKQLINYFIFSSLSNSSNNFNLSSNFNSPYNQQRAKIYKNILTNSEVLKYKEFIKFVNSFYYCEYKNCFNELDEYLNLQKDDPITGNYLGYFKINFKIKIYQQFLTSYKTVSLKKMSESFNISILNLENDLRSFIFNQNLNITIDRIDQIINVNDNIKSLIQNENTEILKLKKESKDILKMIKKEVS